MKKRFPMAMLVASLCVLMAGRTASACVSGATRAPVAQLLPNHPNPFNPNTTIRYVLPSEMRVTILVHDVSGRVVATLLDDVRPAGAHQVTWNADGMASGVYFAHLRARNTDVSRKMVLLK
jgi:hypothetical protein